MTKGGGRIKRRRERDGRKELAEVVECRPKQVSTFLLCSFMCYFAFFCGGMGLGDGVETRIYAKSECGCATGCKDDRIVSLWSNDKR